MNIYANNDSSNPEIYLRRSTDNGATFGDLEMISDPGHYSTGGALASFNNMVYCVWRVSTPASKFFYKRSTDSGTTWSDSVGLSFTGQLWSPMIYASSVNDVTLAVSVANQSTPYTKHIFTMVSNDGGKTFSVPYDHTPPTTKCGEIFPSLWQLGSSIHLVYSYGNGCGAPCIVKYTMSKDYGKTWSSVQNLAQTNITYEIFISVSGSVVHITYSNIQNNTNSYSVYYTRNPTGN